MRQVCLSQSLQETKDKAKRIPTLPGGFEQPDPSEKCTRPDSLVEVFGFLSSIRGAELSGEKDEICLRLRCFA